MKTDLTQGSIKKHYFRYLYASFGSAMISCIYGMIDSAVVGHYQGPNGTAALAVVLPIWTIIYSLGLLIGIGGSVIYSYNKGQNKVDKANAYFSLSLIHTVTIAIICWLGITIFDDELLRLFGADDTLLPLAKEYLLPIKFVIPAFPFTQMLSAFLRNDNAPGLATFAVLFGGVFNVIGDLIFVFVFDMGMFGAGLATAMGATISVMLMLTHFFSKKSTIKLTSIYGHLHKTKVLSISGFSAFIVDMAMGIIAMLFNRQIMYYFNADALAVFGVIVQVSTVVQCSTYGVGQAVQPIISVNHGAKKWERIKETRKYALWTVAILGVFWSVVVLCIPNAFVKLFMSPTKSVLEIAPEIIRIYGLSYMLLPLNIFAIYYFQSVMKPNTSLIISLARGIFLCGTFVFLLPNVFGKAALWYVMPLTELVVAIFVLVNIKRSVI